MLRKVVFLVPGVEEKRGIGHLDPPVFIAAKELFFFQAPNHLAGPSAAHARPIGDLLLSEAPVRMSKKEARRIERSLLCVIGRKLAEDRSKHLFKRLQLNVYARREGPRTWEQLVVDTARHFRIRTAVSGDRENILGRPIDADAIDLRNRLHRDVVAQ